MKSAATEGVARLRQEVRSIIAPLDGRIFNTAGDSVMVEFPTVSAGIQAATRLLALTKARELALPRVRIGLHLGEVIVAEGGDLLGHGVNVAARLQALAEPGTAVLSQPVRAQVKPSTGASLTPLGQVHLDKMHERIEAYVLSTDGRRAFAGWRRWRMAAGALAVAAFVALALFVWRPWEANATTPRLAVLRFENLGDTEPYFSEGVADELIGEMSRISGLEVTARSSSFALTGEDATAQGAARELGATLVLTGSLRNEPNQVYVRAQLVSAPSGTQIWDQEFRRPRDEIYELQRDIAMRVANAARLRLPSRTARTVDPAAYDLYVRAREHIWIEDFRTARALLHDVVRRDPDFAQAWSGLSFAEMRVALAERADGRPAENDWDAALEAADRALNLDASLSEPYEMKVAVMIVRRNWREAAESAEAAAERGGSSFGFLNNTGEIEAALQVSQRVFELDPLDRRNTQRLAVVCLLAEERSCRRSAAQRSYEQGHTYDDFTVYMFALIDDGDLDGARALMREFDESALGPDPREALNRAREYWLSMLGEGPPVTAAQLMAPVLTGDVSVNGRIRMLVASSRAAEAVPYLQYWGDRDRGAFANLFRARGAPLRQAPEFWALMEREGLLAYWRESGNWPDFCEREPVCPR